MRGYALTRFAIAIPTLIAISIGIFVLVRLIPGDRATMTLTDYDRQARALDIEVLRERLGLNDPVWIQYKDWIGDVVSGGFGTSLVTGNEIGPEISQRIQVTFELGVFALIMSVVIGIPLGTLSALRQDTVGDYVARSFAIAGLSLPGFWLGTLVVVFPALWFQWTPPAFYTSIREDPVANLLQMLPPAAILAIALAASQMRIMRSSMLDVLRQDYVRTAYSKGLHNRTVVMRHAMKNALIPVVTVAGLQIGILFGGSAIMEQIFGLPGMGAYLLRAIGQRDYPVIQAVTLLFAAGILFVNLVVDLTYSLLDPRIRYSLDA